MNEGPVHIVVLDEKVFHISEMKLRFPVLLNISAA